VLTASSIQLHELNCDSEKEACTAIGIQAQRGLNGRQAFTSMAVYLQGKQVALHLAFPYNMDDMKCNALCDEKWTRKI
jgi:hypothetical protein